MFGQAEVWPSKSFLPRFFTKKRAVSRGSAPGRFFLPLKALEGVKGGTLAGGSPFAGGTVGTPAIINPPSCRAAGLGQYSKLCAFSRTMSLTFISLTLVEFSFSSSFMAM